MNPFSTHIPTLNNLIQTYKIDTVFEFGCGLYSTNLFVNFCKEVFACEMQSREWYEKVKNDLGQYANLNLVFFDEKNNSEINANFLSIEYLKSLNRSFDLIFVDGHKDSRWLCINECKNYTNIIVTHDTEDTRNYHWHRINLDDTWVRKDIKNYIPWTTYWIKK